MSTAVKGSAAMTECPFKTCSRPSGCDLVDDPEGIRAFIKSEYCDMRRFMECPLFVSAMRTRLEEAEREFKNSHPKVVSKPPATQTSPLPPGGDRNHDQRAT